MFDTLYSVQRESAMIKNFKHKGLEKFFTVNSKKGIQPEHAKKLHEILAALNSAKRVGNMDAQSWQLHPLKHWGEDFWAVKVNGNWRITFRFLGEDAHDVDYVDYH
jgi:proteic killer suppression protein